MEDKTIKNTEKWNAEKDSLEMARKHLKEFIKLKEDKAEKEAIKDEGDVLEKIFEENKFFKLDWKEVKRSKASRSEGLEKIEKKIADRKKKIEKAVAEEESQSKTESSDGRDWSDEISKCAPSSIFYHWIYGKMEVLHMEEDYLYMKLIDKKRCKSSFLAGNNVLLDVNGKEESVKEFSIYSIGKWLFPEEGDVKIIDEKLCHKMFAK